MKVLGRVLEQCELFLACHFLLFSMEFKDLELQILAFMRVEDEK